jgi:hypothetical protein
MLLRDFGPYRVIFISMCVDVTVAMVLLLMDFWALCDNIRDYVFLCIRCHGMVTI